MRDMDAMLVQEIDRKRMHLTRSECGKRGQRSKAMNKLFRVRDAVSSRMKPKEFQMCSRPGLGVC